MCFTQLSKYPLQLAKDFVMPYSKEQLNYFRMIYIVMEILPGALRELFKEGWRRFYGGRWRDRRKDGRRFFSNESLLNRQRNREVLKIIVKGDSSTFDCSILFYCILFSDSVGADLKKRYPLKYDDIHRLRELRNEVCHAPKCEVKDSEFQSFCSETIACFRNLNLPTQALEAIAKEKSFDTEKVVTIKAAIGQMTISEYEQYFSKKFSTLRKNFNPSPYLWKMKDQGVLSEGDVEDIYDKGAEVVTPCLNLLSETDPEAASSFTDFLAPNICNYVPEKIHRATVKYPKDYKLVMRTFTDAIYKLDWQEFKRQSAIFLRKVPDWATKLFVQIELAYGYNIQGESETAMRLLDDAIANSWKAGENSPRILSRVLARKSLKMVYEQRHSESRALAEEASSAVSTIKSPEEEIVWKIRIVECLLSEDGSLESKKERFTPVWNSVIELCQRNMDSVPRSSFYLKFVFAYKALLHLGFSKRGFHPCPSSVSDLDEAERCVQRLEEPDLKTEPADTYADAFRLICKSKIAFDKSKVVDLAVEVETWQKEALSFYEKATAACKSAQNNGIFKLSSLKKYLKNDKESGNLV